MWGLLQSPYLALGQAQENQPKEDEPQPRLSPCPIGPGLSRASICRLLPGLSSGLLPRLQPKLWLTGFYVWNYTIAGGEWEEEGVVERKSYHWDNNYYLLINLLRPRSWSPAKGQEQWPTCWVRTALHIYMARLWEPGKTKKEEEAHSKGRDTAKSPT